MSGSKDRGVQFWDPITGNAQMMLQGHKNSGKFVWIRSEHYINWIQSSPLPPALRTTCLPLAVVICVHVFGGMLLVNTMTGLVLTSLQILYLYRTVMYWIWEALAHVLFLLFVDYSI